MYYAILNNIIKSELDKNRRLAIYPYGRIGMQARDILEKRFGVNAILIDNNLKNYNPKVISITDFKEIDSEDITIILCTSRADLDVKLSQQIESMELKASLIRIMRPAIASDSNAGTCILQKKCVLQRKAEKCGLFSFFIVFLGGINYCIKNNLVPIVDMLSYDNIYHGGAKVNSWELFFEQPMGIGLEEAEDADCINCNEITDRPNVSMDFLTNDKKVSYWREICRKYVRMNSVTRQYVNDYIKKYMPQDWEEETIGVLCRGTDYTELKPYEHPVQPEAREVIAKVRQFLEKYQCKYVYLATEDMNICEVFSVEFKERLIVPDMVRYKNTGKKYLADLVKKQNDIQKEGRDYLASIYILSKCKYLIAGRTSGSVGAFILSEGYDEVYMWNDGYYGVE